MATNKHGIPVYGPKPSRTKLFETEARLSEIDRTQRDMECRATEEAFSNVNFLTLLGMHG